MYQGLHLCSCEAALHRADAFILAVLWDCQGHISRGPSTAQAAQIYGWAEGQAICPVPAHMDHGPSLSDKLRIERKGGPCASK